MVLPTMVCLFPIDELINAVPTDMSTGRDDVDHISLRLSFWVIVVCVNLTGSRHSIWVERTLKGGQTLLKSDMPSPSHRSLSFILGGSYLTVYREPPQLLLLVNLDHYRQHSAYWQSLITVCTPGGNDKAS